MESGGGLDDRALHTGDIDREGVHRGQVGEVLHDRCGWGGEDHEVGIGDCVVAGLGDRVDGPTHEGLGGLVGAGIPADHAVAL